MVEKITQTSRETFLETLNVKFLNLSNATRSAACVVISTSQT